MKTLLMILLLIPLFALSQKIQTGSSYFKCQACKIGAVTYNGLSYQCGRCGERFANGTQLEPLSVVSQNKAEYQIVYTTKSNLLVGAGNIIPTRSVIISSEKTKLIMTFEGDSMFVSGDMKITFAESVTRPQSTVCNSKLIH